MSLKQLVVELMEDHGPMNVDELMPRISSIEGVSVTRKQVITAIGNAHHDGLVERVEARPSRKGMLGSPPSRFCAVKKPPPPRPVSSVWELGARA